MHSSLLHLAIGFVCLGLMPQGPTDGVLLEHAVRNSSLHHQPLGSVAECECNCAHDDV